MKWQRNLDASNANDSSKRELLDCYINCLCSFSMLELSLGRLLNAVCAQAPSAILETFLEVRSRGRLR